MALNKRFVFLSFLE